MADVEKKETVIIGAGLVATLPQSEHLNWGKK